MRWTGPAPRGRSSVVSSSARCVSHWSRMLGRWQRGLSPGQATRSIGKQAIGRQLQQVESYSGILIEDLRQLAFADPEQIDIRQCAGSLGSFVVRGEQADLSEQVTRAYGMIDLLEMDIAGYDHVETIGMIAPVEDDFAGVPLGFLHERP